jgi:hypothetical protein
MWAQQIEKITHQYAVLFGTHSFIFFLIDENMTFLERQNESGQITSTAVTLYGLCV